MKIPAQYSAFDGLEIGGCTRLPGGGAEGGVDARKADFFTVYGHLKTGGVDDISDHKTFEDALAAAERIAAVTGFSIFMNC